MPILRFEAEFARTWRLAQHFCNRNSRNGTYPAHGATGLPNWCLQFHAGYRCRHSGACCTAGWPIPIERDVHATLRLHFHDQPERFDYEAPRPDGAAATAAIRASGDCAFFESDRGRLCAIHRELGAERLPDACRQFPRVVLHDPRGTLISLSHFCPTAAALLPRRGPFGSCAAGSYSGLDGAAEGLDARGVLPPLLRPGMLTDCEGYDAWEARAIATLDRDDVDADAALARLENATRRLGEWRPGGGAAARGRRRGLRRCIER